MPDTDIEQMEEVPFAPVTVQRAGRLLRELDWGDHFVGVSMNPAMGNNNAYCYSLEESLRFLTQGSSRLGILKGSMRSGMSWVDIPDFIAWIRDKVGDSELATSIEAALAALLEKAQADSADDIAFLEQIDVVTEQVGLRVFQLQKVVEDARRAMDAASEDAKGVADDGAEDPASDGAEDPASEPDVLPDALSATGTDGADAS